MQRPAEESTARRKMAELRLACEREIRIQRERAACADAAFRQFLDSIRSMVDETLKNRDKNGNLKYYLKELEDDFVGARTAKIRREAKFTATTESLSNIVVRTEQLKNIVKDQRERKDEYAAIISGQLAVLEMLEEKSSGDITEREDIEEVILWYERVLGIQIEAGEGVKFTFNKIHVKNPAKEYTFTIRLDGDIYTLLHCDPYLEGKGIHELMKGLNKTNDLFKFVRIMREKFQAASLNDVPANPDSSSVTLSSPPPTSVDSRSEILFEQTDPRLQSVKVMQDPPQGITHRQFDTQSPKSLSALRRSPRLVARRFP